MTAPLTESEAATMRASLLRFAGLLAVVGRVRGATVARQAADSLRPDRWHELSGSPEVVEQLRRLAGSLGCGRVHLVEGRV